MLIDWFTVSAQIINFLILIFLLKYFLYGKIITAMKMREEKIAAKLQEAEQKIAEAEKERASYIHKNNEFDAKRDNLFAQTREKAESEKKEFFESARKEVEEVKERWYDSLRKERQAFLRSLRKRVEKQMYTIANRALSDLSNSNLEQSMIDTFLSKMKKLDQNELKKLCESIRKSGNTVVISSVFAISSQRRQEILNEMRIICNEEIDITCEISPDSICGLELRIDNYRIGWNISDYLKTLEEEVNSAFEEEPHGKKMRQDKSYL
ncbi:MAG: hypothetical protein MRJ65_07520 [Candidatus Brocadiaceae bacterium]|nr:hypothetical protein [Candidatus Brocadiaceae bacterium]